MYGLSMTKPQHLHTMYIKGSRHSSMNIVHIHYVAMLDAGLASHIRMETTKARQPVFGSTMYGKLALPPFCFTFSRHVGPPAGQG